MDPSRGVMVALSLSVLAHVVLGAWVSRSALPLRLQRAEKPPLVWLDSKPPESLLAVEPLDPPTLHPPKPPGRKPVTQAAPAAPRAPLSNADVSRRDLPDDAPRAGPGAAAAVRSFALPTVDAKASPAQPSGETVYPDDPRLSRAVLDEQTRTRVKARVEGFALDELATARVQSGLPHPYFTVMREAVRAELEALARAEGMHPTAAMVGEALTERFYEASSSYAKTGDPNLGPAGLPRPSERLTLPEQAPMRALALAKETMDDLTNGQPLRALTVEVRQPKGPGAATLTVLVTSNDPAFDAFVLRTWHQAMAEVGPPPADASRAIEVRSVWVIEAWQRIGRGDEYLPSFMGLPTSRLMSLAREEGYDFHARLLRAY